MSSLLPAIAPQEARRLIEEAEAILVDVREPDDFAAGHIAGAVNVPLSRLDGAAIAAKPGQPVVFHGLSRIRTHKSAAELAALAGQGRAHDIAGGLKAWRQAGLHLAGASPAAKLSWLGRLFGSRKP